MRTLKLVEIGKTPSIKKYQFWNEQLKAQNFQVEASAVELPDIVELKKATETAKTQAECIRYQSDLWSFVPSLSVHEPAAVHNVESSDGLAKDKGGWFPREMISSSMSDIVRTKIHSVDYKGIALIIGTNAMARIATQVVASWGVKRVNFVPESSEDMAPWLLHLHKQLFGLELNILDPQTLTLQPANCSLIVNTLKHDEHPDILNDIYYFNFLKKEGVVIDMITTSEPTQLIQESKRLDVRFVEGCELTYRADFAWFSHFQQDLRLERSKQDELLQQYRVLLE